MISTVEKISKGFKNWSRLSRRSLDMAYALKSRFMSRSRSRLSISTPKKYQSRRSRKSRQFQKLVSTAKDVLDLDLDWSRRRDPQAYKYLLALPLRPSDAFSPSVKSSNQTGMTKSVEFLTYFLTSILTIEVLEPFV